MLQFDKDQTFSRVLRRGLGPLAVGLTVASVVAVVAPSSVVAGLTCRKVVAASATGEGRNSAEASRVKCAPGEMLTGGACYPEVRPEADGSCETSAMGMIQTVIDHAGTTEEAFYSCLQTGGTDCPVAERTRAMGICCKIEE